MDKLEKMRRARGQVAARAEAVDGRAGFGVARCCACTPGVISRVFGSARLNGGPSSRGKPGSVCQPYGSARRPRQLVARRHRQFRPADSRSSSAAARHGVDRPPSRYLFAISRDPLPLAPTFRACFTRSRRRHVERTLHAARPEHDYGHFVCILPLFFGGPMKLTHS